ncbi:MAG: hypothetical protein AAFV93_20975 [Chloroflexota bacterium]
MENLFLKRTRQLIMITFAGLVGALIAMVSAILLIAILSFPVYGFGSIGIGLYFALTLLVYIAPIGAIIGSALKVRAYTKQRTQKTHLRYRISEYGLYSPIVIFILLPAYVLFNTGQQRLLTHEARWTSVEHNDCEHQAIVMFLTQHYEEFAVCSSDLTEQLTSTNPEYIPVVLRVTYDFGEVRGYRLVEVDNVEITALEWMGGYYPCAANGESLHPFCSLETRQDGSFLYSDTWDR